MSADPDEPSGPEDLRDQAKSFADDLEALIRRYSDEYDLELYEIIGLLQTEIFALCHHAYTADESEDDEED